MMYVTDAVGGRSQAAHRTGIERLAHAGAVPTTALAVMTEPFRDWASPLARPALRTSSTGTSARSATTPTRSASPRPRSRPRRALHSPERV